MKIYRNTIKTWGAESLYFFQILFTGARSYSCNLNQLYVILALGLRCRKRAGIGQSKSLEQNCSAVRATDIRKQTRLSRSTRHAHVDVRPPSLVHARGWSRAVEQHAGGSFSFGLWYSYLLAVSGEGSNPSQELFLFFVSLPTNRAGKSLPIKKGCPSPIDWE